MDTQHTPKRIAIVDVAIVGGVSLMYVTFEALQAPKRWSFLAVGIALVVYALFVVHRRADSWTDLGFRTDNLRAALLPFSAATLAAGLCIVVWAQVHGRAHWGREAVILLALYPAWAVAQQVAFQGLLHRRLMVLLRSSVLQVLITATAFAAVHFGNPTLVALTFAAGVLWSLLYRRWPNIWLLGASHSLLAALAYPLILGDKPLSRL
jgi:membrane protease YdiL (CAAX protease family)